MKAHLSANRPPPPPAVLTLAHLLQRLENSAEPVDPAQYRSVALHLVQEFQVAPQDGTLEAVLDSYPCAAELYENFQYEHAGLCRSALTFSMAAELQAKDVIDKARREAGTLNQDGISGEE